MTHNSYAPVAPWEKIEGKPYEQNKLGAHICLVRTEPLPQGYLFQIDKGYGFKPTLAEAKQMAEALLEQKTGVMIGS